MKSFVVKTLIASIIFYVLFEIMIGSRLDIVQNYLELGKDKSGRMKIMLTKKSLPNKGKYPDW